MFKEIHVNFLFGWFLSWYVLRSRLPEKCLNQVLLWFHFSRSSEECTKRWGMLALVNQLFKVYFRINKLHLCKPLIRAIDSSPFKDHFTLGQRVTYRFYVGRKAMFDSDYKAGKFSIVSIIAFKTWPNYEFSITGHTYNVISCHWTLWITAECSKHGVFHYCLFHFVKTWSASDNQLQYLGKV